MFEDLRTIESTPLFKHNSDVNVVCSPNSQKYAYAVKNELLVKKLRREDFEPDTATRYICDIEIELISWSHDSELILCANPKEILVWNVMVPSWKCTIKEGLLELTNVIWAPDSRHLLVFSELNLKLTVWSIISLEYTVIEDPKDCKNCFSFSSCSKYMAVLQRRDFSDYIGIYSTDNWQLIKRFQLDTDKASEIQFSKVDPVIAVLVSVTDDYKALFYSIDGRLLHTFCRKDTIFGITSFCWNPVNNISILGDYFEMITLLDGRSYKEIHSMNLPQSILSENVKVYGKEDSEPCFFIPYVLITERPVILSPPSTDSQQSKNKDSKKGIRFLKLSADGRYAAIVGWAMPNILFIFNMKKFAISTVIINETRVRSVAWHPSESVLLFCISHNTLDAWTPTSVTIMPSHFCLRQSFTAKSYGWCSKDSMIVNGKDASAIISLP